MKINRLIIMLLFFPILVKGQSEVKNTIKFNPLGLFVGQYMATYERALSERVSFQVAGGYIQRSFNSSYNGRTLNQNISGFIIIPEIRYFFLNQGAPKGLYASVFFRYRNTTDKGVDNNEYGAAVDYDYKEKMTAVGGGILAGYQFIIADRVAIDLFIGPQNKSTTYDKTFSDPNATTDGFNDTFFFNNLFRRREGSGLGIRTGFNIGIAF